MTITQTQEVRIMPPMKITGLLQAQWANEVLKTAVKLDIFTALKTAANGMTSDELASKLKLDAKGARLILDALVAMEYLEQKEQRYLLTDIAQAYLVTDSVLFMGGYISGREDLNKSWAQLQNTIKTGKPAQRVNTREEAEKFFPELARAIFPLGYTTTQSLADKLNIKAATSPVHVLDLAAGSGVWSLPMAQCNSKVQVDALDFPAIIKVTEEFATRFGVAQQYNYLRGSWREIQLQANHYDIIVAGHILHSEGKEASEDLLRYMAAALKPGGKLIIGEFFKNDRAAGPLFVSLFALNMMLATSDGCVFSVDEMKEMITAAGLQKPERLELPFWGSESPVMVAQK